MTAKSLGSATTHILMLNHQCPRLRRRTREPAANLLSICLLSCSSRDLQKLRLLFLFICCRLQRYLFSFTSRHFFENILRTHNFSIYCFVRHSCYMLNYYFKSTLSIKNSFVSMSFLYDHRRHK